MENFSPIIVEMKYDKRDAIIISSFGLVSLFCVFFLIFMILFIIFISIWSDYNKTNYQFIPDCNVTDIIIKRECDEIRCYDKEAYRIIFRLDGKIFNGTSTSNEKHKIGEKVPCTIEDGQTDDVYIGYPINYSIYMVIFLIFGFLSVGSFLAMIPSCIIMLYKCIKV